MSNVNNASLISQGTGSVIGTMNVRTSNAFDGNNDQNDGNSASHDFAATTVTLGKDFGAGNAKVVNQVRCWGYNGGGFTSNAGQTCTIAVIGSNTGLGSDEVTLFTSGTITDSSNANAQNFSFSNSTAYRYVYIKLTQGVSNYFFVAELEFYEEVTVGFGTTGFLIEGGAAFTNGTDSSGNSQNFTKGGTITNVNDTLTDKASDNFGNYCTWNFVGGFPSAKVSLSNGNTTATVTPDGAILANQFFDVTDSDGFYWETKFTSNISNAEHVGIGQATVPLHNTSYRDNGIATYLSDGGSEGTASGSLGTTGNRASGGTHDTWQTNNDIISVAVKGGAIWFAKNNVWQDGANGGASSATVLSEINAGTTTNAFFTGLTGLWAPMVRGHSGSATPSTTNWGATAFTYTPPTNMKRLMTANLPAPTVTKPDDYFNTLTWSGDSSSPENITGLDFRPDLIWGKTRNATFSHQLYDSVRGFGNDKELQPDTTTVEGGGTADQYGYISGTLVNGFTATKGSDGGSDAYGYWNESGKNYVAWCWKAGDSNTAVSSSGSGSGATNACTHRANTTSGLSIIKYTGFNGTLTANGQHTLITHGLGTAPVFMIGKSLDTVQDWFCLPGENDPTGSGRWGLDNHMRLNTIDDSSGSLHVQPAFPNETSIFIGRNDLVNKNGDEFIMYAWIRVPGMCAYGTYKGDTTNLPYIVVNDGGSGFRPAWIMIKRLDSDEGWHINDAARDTFNPLDLQLQPNSSGVESGSSYMDFTANGFKLRGSQGATNANGGTYLYLAMAENPFGGDGVAQAKAR